MRARAIVVGAALLAGCGNTERPACPPVEGILPSTGTGMARTGLLVPQGEAQSLTISAARDQAEYKFTRDGVTYTARYALGREAPPVVMPFVFVRRALPLEACATLVDKGPVIDAIELRRGGSVISSGEDAYASSARCPGQGLTNKAPAALNGPRDGAGAALGDAEYGWRWAGRITLEPGDEVAVTVLDTSGEPFVVFAGYGQTQPTLELGVLTGSGTVPVP